MRRSNILVLFTALLAAGIAQVPRAQEPVRIIEIHAQRFAFTPSEISLKKGETVTLRLISEDVPHSLLIKDLNINRETSKGHPADIAITPQTTGDFHGKCGRFCGGGHGKMVFMIHVRD